MTEFAARIGRVRMKDGGADVHIIEGHGCPEGKGAELINLARHVASESEPGSTLEGYIIIALYSDMARNVSFDLDGAHGIPCELLPSYVAELLRRKVITQAEACTVVNIANGYDED